MKYLSVFALSSFVASASIAEHWVQWRGGASRCGSSLNQVKGDLQPAWSLDYGYPDPAFEHQFRMCADATYAPVAADGLLFVPSALRDEVVALSLADGGVKWRFITGAPVRLAPVVSDGRLYFGCDDGFLYCLDAKSGVIKWKVRGVPDENPQMHMLVNGRLCSRWPVRGAPVLHEGVVYFGAGVWPEEGVWVNAVDAITGAVKWRSDALSVVIDGMNDHSRHYDLGLPPLGYLAVINGKLAVPSGRSLAAFFDLESGKMDPYTCYYVKLEPPRGTWYLCGNEKFWVQGGNIFGTTAELPAPLPPDTMPVKVFAEMAGVTTAEALKRCQNIHKQHHSSVAKGVKIKGEGEDAIITYPFSKPISYGISNEPRGGFRDNELYNLKNRPLLSSDIYNIHHIVYYSEPVLHGDVMCKSIYTDPQDYVLPRGETYVNYREFDKIVAYDLTGGRWTVDVKDGKMPRKWEFPVKWELDVPHKVIAASGNHLIAATSGELILVEIPKAGEQPKIAWKQKTDGTVVNALVVDGLLVTVTDAGVIDCFASGGTGTVVAAPGKDEVAAPRVSFPKGYCLVLGWGDGKVQERLLSEREYQLIVLEPDLQVVKAQRLRLAEQGVYGRAIQIVHYDAHKMSVSPYWANYVVLNRPDVFGEVPEVVDLAVNALRPYSGRLLVNKDTKIAKLIKEKASGSEFQVRVEGNWLLVDRKYPPDGFDDWTHENGSAANTFAGGDTVVKPPFGLLWYSGTVDRFFTPQSHFQHNRHPYPIVCGGRMFLVTSDLLHAVDIYTGNHLWSVKMPSTQRVQWRESDSRIYERPYDRNYVLSVDTAYVILEKEIVLYDTASGEKKKVFELPEGATADSIWTEVRIEGESLYSVVGKQLFCLDRVSGAVKWKYLVQRDSITYAIGNDKLYVIDYEMPPRFGGGKEQYIAGFSAFKSNNGKVLWRRKVNYTGTPEDSDPVIQSLNTRLWVPPAVPAVIYNEKHDRILVVFNRVSYRNYTAVDGKEAWRNTASFIKGAKMQKSGKRSFNIASKWFNIHSVNLPTVTSDLIIGPARDYDNNMVVYDVRSGEEIEQEDSWLPHKRSCARLLGNDCFMAYRNASTEVFDMSEKKRYNYNSIRTGCTSSAMPAGGVLSAPNYGQGCVCNYPAFLSVSLIHMPDVEVITPERVTKRMKERSPGGINNLWAQ